MELTDIAFTAKPTYKLRITFGISPSNMHTTVCLVDAGADVNLISSSMTPPRWTSGIEQQNVPQLQAATNQPLPLDGLLAIRLHLSKLSTHI